MTTGGNGVPPVAIVVADDPFYAPGTSPGQRRFSSAALLAGPLALLAAQLLDPTPAEADAADLLATAAAEPARWVATNLLFVLGTILLVFGSFGLASLLRGRGSRLGQPGLTLLVAGVVALAGWATSNLALEAVAVAISDSRAITAVEIVWIVGLMLGLVLVAVALLRAGSVPRWHRPRSWSSSRSRPRWSESTWPRRSGSRRSPSGWARWRFASREQPQIRNTEACRSTTESP
jgi:hypothetical protein